MTAAETRNGAAWIEHRVDPGDAADDHRPGRPGRRDRQLAEGRRARADAAGGLPPPREDHPLRPRAHPRARRARARRRRARLLPGLRVARGRTPRRSSCTTRRCGRRCSCASRPWPGRAARPTPSATCAASRPSSTPNEGNFDLVGNNIPVFFIQDGIKFPDFVHAVKPEPHNEMPQAPSAHDTFWDFVSLQPETHAHDDVADVGPGAAAQLPDDAGLRRAHLPARQRGRHGTFVKFHWKPRLGMHSLVWDEAQKIAGKDPDFNRRDLWEAIEAGDFPEWELGVQLVARGATSTRFDFDLLDATKIIPEELVPVRPVGQHGAQPQPGQLLRRDRAGRLPPRQRRAGHRLHQRPAAAGRGCSPTSTPS